MEKVYVKKFEPHWMLEPRYFVRNLVFVMLQEMVDLIWRKPTVGLTFLKKKELVIVVGV